MFNLLKNKVSEFLSKIIKKEEEKKPTDQLTEEKKTQEEVKEQSEKEKQPEPTKEVGFQKPITEKVLNKEDKKKEQEFSEQKTYQQNWKKIEQAALKDKKEFAPKVGIIKQITTIFEQEIKIEKKDIEQLLAELEVSLLEADVAYEASRQITNDLEKRLIGKKIQKDSLEKKIKEEIEQAFLNILNLNLADFEEIVDKLIKERQGPIKILFVGPNGAGKTTTIAKIGQFLRKKDYSVVISASDTFRAAAIEQLENHCQKIGVKLIKNKYGADPASVAFDAIKYARTSNIDFVLIDTAGRQNTNTNLIDEMKKIARVSQPHLKIYVGESIGGNAVIEQIKTFNNAIGLDGIILTKIDCDAKGGTVISLAYTTKVPIMFFGAGQGYSDLKKFEPKWVLEKILPN